MCCTQSTALLERAASPGNSVRVMSGKHKGTTGMVTRVKTVVGKNEREERVATVMVRDSAILKALQ